MGRMKTFHGYVQAPASQFRIEDGTTLFRPFNDYYGTVYPGAAPVPRAEKQSWLSGLSTPDGRNVEFDLNDGEYFHVREEIDKSEGRMGTKAAGDFLDYPTAFRAAAGKNVQGGRGAIVIMSPAGTEDITAVDADGTTVVIESRTLWRAIDLASLLRFTDTDAAGS
jgi:hypothetical protein